MVFAQRVLWVVVSLALMVGLGFVGPAWAEPVDGASSGDRDGSLVELVRPDWVSASVTARVQGRRVEVLSERSETTRVFVRPDGSVEEEIATGPVRFADSSGADGWRDIDTSLRVSGSSVVPASMPMAVELAGGSSAADLVVFDRGGAREVAVALTGVSLPEPELEGATALYREVFPGVDASVEVRTSGFELLWIVKSPGAARGLVARRGKGVAQAAKRLINGTTKFRRKSANFGLNTYVSSKFGAYGLYDTYGRRRRR